GVQVDETRGNDQARTIDGLFASTLELADGNDALALDGQVAFDGGLAAAIAEGGATDQVIGFGGSVGPRCQQEQGQDSSQHGKPRKEEQRRSARQGTSAPACCREAGFDPWYSSATVLCPPPGLSRWNWASALTRPLPRSSPPTGLVPV